MTTIQQPKELTVERYRFYKTQETPLTDEKIMAIHKMKNNQLNLWKKENNLIGVKFEPKVKVNKMTVTKGDGALLKENDIPKERLKSPSSPSVDSKPAPLIDKNDLQPPRPSVTTEEIQTLAEQVKSRMDAPAHDSEGADNTVNLKDAEIEELKKQIIWLEERHVKDMARIDESNAKRYDEIARADMWREKCRITEMELRDKNCEIEKQKEQHYIQLCNLQNDVRKANEALELHHHDEQLLFQTMKKLVSVSDRLNESVEGGKDLWR